MATRGPLVRQKTGAKTDVSQPRKWMDRPMYVLFFYSMKEDGLSSFIFLIILHFEGRRHFPPRYGGIYLFAISFFFT